MDPRAYGDREAFSADKSYTAALQVAVTVLLNDKVGGWEQNPAAHSFSFSSKPPRNRLNSLLPLENKGFRHFTVRCPLMNESERWRTKRHEARCRWRCRAGLRALSGSAERGRLRPLTE